MKAIPVYRHKDTVIHALHPLAAITLVFSLLAMVLVLQQPVYLAMVGTGIWSLLLFAEIRKEARPFLKLGIFMAAMVAIINPLVNHRGTHVLVYGPDIPPLGRLDITLEALVYGVVSGFRMFLVVLVFGLASIAVNPDRLLELLSRLASRSAASAALAVRLYPSLVVEAREMMEVQLARGMRLRGGNRRERLKAWLPFWSALFQGSLDRSASIAESMSARGFGGSRVTWKRMRFHLRDLFFAVLSLAGVATAVLLNLGKGGDFNYFPSITNPLQGLRSWFVASVGGQFLGMALISWSWKKWPWWRSRV